MAFVERGGKTVLTFSDDTASLDAMAASLTGVVRAGRVARLTIDSIDGVNALRAPDRAFIVITHYQRLLDYIVPDVVHVMSQGQIVKSGDKDLAKALEASGYAEYRTGEAA